MWFLMSIIGQSPVNMNILTPKIGPLEMGPKTENGYNDFN
jgi:hypothetical protein